MFIARTIVQRTQPGMRQTVKNEEYFCHVYVRADSNLAGECAAVRWVMAARACCGAAAGALDSRDAGWLPLKHCFSAQAPSRPVASAGAHCRG